MMKSCGQIFFIISLLIKHHTASKPLVINTWNFQDAAKEGILYNAITYLLFAATCFNMLAWRLVGEGESAVASLEAGCKVCEELQCDFTVGYGGSPDENGETTLDALIFDGYINFYTNIGSLLF